MLQYKKRRNYKYTLAAPYQFATGLTVDKPIHDSYIAMSMDGRLTLNAAYAWDGASGPMPDFRCIMRASLIHDALYQLIREQKLPSSYRPACDQLLRQICLQDGMNVLLANWVYLCVRLLGANYAKPDLLTLSPIDKRKNN